MNLDSGRSDPDWAGPLFVVTASLVLTLRALTLPADIHWLDAPEITAAAWNLGQAHPPGHPVMMMLLKAFLLLPIGGAAFRANLFAAFFGAVGAGLVALLGRDMARRAGAGRAWAAAAGFASGLGFGLCGSMGIQSLSVEVYSLNLALVAGALVLALRGPGDARVAVVVAVLAAVGIANHHFLTVLALPALVVAWWPPRADALPRSGHRPTLSALALALAGGVLVAAGSYGYLIVRGLAGAWPAWTDTSTLDGAAWVASAAVFAQSVGGFEATGGGIVPNLAKAASVLAGNVTAPGLVLGAAGLYVLARRGHVRAAVAVALFVGGGLASKVMMGILDPSNPDDHGYFLPAIGGLFALCAILPAVLASAAEDVRSRAGRRGLAAAAACLLAALAIVPAGTGAGIADERFVFDDTSRVSRLLWDDVPTGAVVFLSHYPVFFLAQYDQEVEGARPDVVLVQQSLYRKARGGHDYARALARRAPDLAPLVRFFADTGALSWDEVLALAARRPVRFEPADDLAPPPGDLSPAGWTFAVRGGNEPAVAGADEAPFLEQIRAAGAGWPDPGTETKRVLMRHLAVRATWLARAGMRDAARAAVACARELNDRDATLKRIESDFAR